ncbi:hypothetical protein Ancab_026440 [Ancistrocladus abbreviatus]
MASPSFRDALKRGYAASTSSLASEDPFIDQGSNPYGQEGSSSSATNPKFISIDSLNAIHKALSPKLAALLNCKSYSEEPENNLPQVILL